MHPYFTAPDISELLAQAAIVQLVGEKPIDHDGAAAELNNAVAQFIDQRLVGPPTPFGEVEAWATEVASYARSLIFALGMQPGPGKTRILSDGGLRGVGVVGRVYLWNQSVAKAAAEAGARDSDARESYIRAPAVIRTLLVAAECLAQDAKANKRQGRGADLPQRAMFFHTLNAYELATGYAPALSSTDDRFHGPCLRFHRHFLEMLRGRLAADALTRAP